MTLGKQTFKAGFTLTELLIYLPCSLLLYGSIALLSHTFQSALLKTTSTTEITLELALAMEYILKDLARVSSSCVLEKEGDSISLIFNNDLHGIVWKVDKGRLLRITGNYCKKTGTWKNRATTVFLQNLHSFESVVLYGDPKLPQAIRCTLTKKHTDRLCTLTSFTALLT